MRGIPAEDRRNRHEGTHPFPEEKMDSIFRRFNNSPCIFAGKGPVRTGNSPVSALPAGTAAIIIAAFFLLPGSYAELYGNISNAGPSGVYAFRIFLESVFGGIALFLLFRDRDGGRGRFSFRRIMRNIKSDARFLLTAALLTALLAAAGICLTYTLNRVLMAAEAVRATDGGTGPLFGGTGLPLIIAGVCAVSPFFEEVMMRGILFPALRNRFSFFLSAAAVSFLWAAWHRNPYQFITVFLLGMAFCLIYEVRGSLFYVMFLHAVYNALVMLITFRRAEPGAGYAPASGVTDAGAHGIAVSSVIFLFAGIFLFYMIYTGRTCRFTLPDGRADA